MLNLGFKNRGIHAVLKKNSGACKAMWLKPGLGFAVFGIRV